jgi:hypothetical protein
MSEGIIYMPNCSYCHKDIAPDADPCPECGKKKPLAYLVVKVVLHRKSAFIGAGVRTKVVMDGQILGSLGEEDTISYETNPGNHLFEVYNVSLGLSIKQDTLSLYLDGGITYNIDIKGVIPQGFKFSYRSSKTT